ncbi:unnamed protein product, partial [Mesorhabditis belari]|uniref:Uncharacterized protein n=1 Tax=Mesorhabditis belari TaxID=2138241 RepID=A0AAF3EID1_9BILA
MSRSQMVIPGEGIGELLATLWELIDKYSSEYLDEHISPANLQRLNGFAVKAFYSLDLLLQKSEASFRPSITVPFIRWRNSEGLSKIIDGFEKVPTEEVDGTAE